MNENSIKETALQTFCIVPEIYQQAFQQMGTEFPDELVARIKEMDWVADHYRFGGKLPADEGWKREG